MNESYRQTRSIAQLQNHRRILLQRHEQRGAPITSIDMELNTRHTGHDIDHLYREGVFENGNRLVVAVTITVGLSKTMAF